MPLDLAMISWIRQQKKKQVNRVYSELKVLCIKSTERVKGQPKEWGTMFANRMSDKDQELRLYQELLQLNKTAQLKNGQRNSLAISSKIIYKWPIST